MTATKGQRQNGTAVFFDFDGVLVDSTASKTNAYRKIFSAYGSEKVSEIVEYHQQHAGISRVEKIDFAHKNILSAPYSREQVLTHIKTYSRLVFDKVVAADWVPGALEFVTSHYRQFPLFIISGTPQDELREIVSRRDMGHYFQEILGSPIKKPEHIRDLVARYDLKIENCFFIGDALTDYHAAKETGMPFIGIRSETDFPDGTMVLPDCSSLGEIISSRLQS